MPRLSLEAEVDRLLAESEDATRYMDLAIQVRRLTCSPHVAQGTKLTDSHGRLWIAGEVDEDGAQPVWTELPGQSTKAPDGTILRWSGGEVALDVEVILDCGGVWDRPYRRWRLDAQGNRVAATRPAVVDAVESQVDAVRFMAGRLAAFRERKPHPQSAALLFDDRRGGKSFIATVMLLCAAIECPSIEGMPNELWIVTRTVIARDELEEVIKLVIPPAYYTFTKQERLFTFVHGSKLHCRTTDDVESLRVGYCCWAFLNEGALMPEAALTLVARALQDKDGCCIITTNKPGKRNRRGGWVARLWLAAEQDERDGNVPVCALIRVPEQKNPTVQKGKAKAKILKLLSYARDPDEPDDSDEGIVAEYGELVCSPMWDDVRHIQPLPEVGYVDLTHEVTKRLQGREYDFVIGADFQTECAASAFKFLAPGGDISRVEIWATNSWFMAGGGDEDCLIDSMEADGLSAASSLVIGDCSMGWQSSTHGYGPPSYVPFKRRGWDIIGSTKKKTEKGLWPKNPDVALSTGRLRRLISENRVFCTPTAKILSMCLRKCESRRDAFGNIRPKSNTRYSHNLDTVRYVAWWLTCRPELLTAKTSAPVAFSGRSRAQMGR